MAHKKGGGSSTNGRDSHGQRLGVKRFGGQLVNAGPLGPLVTVIVWLQVMELLHRSVTVHVRVMTRLVGQMPNVAESV